jgi:hypothetical protein
MFIVKKLKDALLALLANSLESAEEAEDAMDNVDMDALTQALCHSARTVYSYRGGEQRCFRLRYRGDELFGQRAALLCREMEEGVADVLTACRYLELWVLDDNRVVLCSDVEVCVKEGEYSFQTDYRMIKGNPLGCDVGIDPDEIIGALDVLCDPVYEHEIPIYEL